MKNLTLVAISLLLTFAGLAAPLLAQSIGGEGRKEDRHCGAKCLYVILRGYGKAPTTYKSLVEDLGPPSVNGYSLLQLSEGARKRGLFAESVKLGKEDLARFANSSSVILHLNIGKSSGKERGHYVVCEGITPTTTTIFDASLGMPSQISHEIFSLWTGSALIISKNPIDLSKPSTSALSTWLKYLGISVLIACSLFGAVWFARFRTSRGLAACIVAVLTMHLGCNSKQESNQITTNQSGTQAKSAAQVLPPAGSGLWVEKSVIDAGTVRRSVTPVLLPIKIHNSEKQPVSIKDSRYSCSCLFAKFSSLTIAPQASIECTLMLECASIGPKQSKAVVLTDNNEQVVVDVSWTVVASLKAEPETFNGMELKCGESKESSAHLTQLEQFDFSKLEVQSLLDKPDTKSFFSASAKIVGENLVAEFSVGKQAPTGLINGKFVVAIPGDEVVSVAIPFTVYVANDIDISPAKVYFTRKGDLLHAQVIVQAVDAGNLTPIELSWIGKTKGRCDFTVQDQNETQVIDITVSPDSVKGVDRLEISVAGGKTMKQLPVIFP